MKVLLIETNEMVRKRTVKAIGNWGYPCQTASDGLQALECLTKEQFRVVISKLTLPGLSGFELFKQARTSNPETAFIMVAEASESA